MATSRSAKQCGNAGTNGWRKSGPGRYDRGEVGIDVRSVNSAEFRRVFGECTAFCTALARRLRISRVSYKGSIPVLSAAKPWFSQGFSHFWQIALAFLHVHARACLQVLRRLPAPGCKCSLATLKPIVASSKLSCCGLARCISLRNSARCGWHAPRMANHSQSSRTILASIRRSSSIFASSRPTKSRRPISTSFPPSPWMGSRLIPQGIQSNTTSFALTQVMAFTRLAATTTASVLMQYCTGFGPIAQDKPAAFRTSCRHCHSWLLDRRFENPCIAQFDRAAIKRHLIGVNLKDVGKFKKLD